jgi:hypothetical protein
VATHDVPLRPMPFLPVLIVVILVILVVVLGGGAAMWFLGVWAHQPRTGIEAERFRLERIKTGLTVAAGLAAGGTLLMTLRRQAVSEWAQRFAESDALEQRTTALYVAAANQLGSDKAAARLTGLYALERLGQDNPKLRQTVVEVWCAYLRMPYTPPLEVRQRNSPVSPENPNVAPGDATDPSVEAERRQELQVRLTAQRLLAAHLDPTLIDAHWLAPKRALLVMDLAGSVLVNFSLRGCVVGRSTFAGTQFHGSVDLSGTQFRELVSMHGAQFHGGAEMGDAECHGFVNFSSVEFYGTASLGGMKMHEHIVLTFAQFHAAAFLSGIEFRGFTVLAETQFHGSVDLRHVRFYEDRAVALPDEQAAGRPRSEFADVPVDERGQFRRAWCRAPLPYLTLLELAPVAVRAAVRPLLPGVGLGDAEVNSPQPSSGSRRFDRFSATASSGRMPAK